MMPLAHGTGTPAEVWGGVLQRLVGQACALQSCGQRSKGWGVLRLQPWERASPGIPSTEGNRVQRPRGSLGRGSRRQRGSGWQRGLCSPSTYTPLTFPSFPPLPLSDLWPLWPTVVKKGGIDGRLLTPEDPRTAAS